MSLLSQPMEIALRQPSRFLTRVTLGAGEQMCAESGAMTSMSLEMEIDAGVKSGVLESLTRSVFGGKVAIRLALHHGLLECTATAKRGADTVSLDAERTAYVPSPRQ